MDPKKAFKFALEFHACSIILGHNHPSGLISPSEADIKITKRLVDAGKLLEIAVLDHLIIGQDRFYSFADEGRLMIKGYGKSGHSISWNDYYYQG